MARIREAGGIILREAGPVKGGTTVIAFVQDPDGYKIELELSAPTARASWDSDSPGLRCWLPRGAGSHGEHQTNHRPGRRNPGVAARPAL